MNRRDFLKASGAVGAGLGLAMLGGSPLAAADLAKGAPNAEKLGWRLACQAWSFNRFTFFDAVDKTASLGLHYIEAYPGQQISKKLSAAMDADMSSAHRKEVLKRLADSRVKLVNFGVGGYDRKHFEFAKAMGIETLVAEPNENDFDALEKLLRRVQDQRCHPQPSTAFTLLESRHGVEGLPRP